MSQETKEELCEKLEELARHTTDCVFNKEDMSIDFRDSDCTVPVDITNSKEYNMGIEFVLDLIRNGWLRV